MSRIRTFWGGQFGENPVVLGTSAVNGLGYDSYQSWAFWRADGSALTESPFRLHNGERATMALIRSLSPRDYGFERLWQICEKALAGIEEQLSKLPSRGTVGVWLALSHFLGDSNDPYFGSVERRLSLALGHWLSQRGMSGPCRCIPAGHAGLAHAVEAAVLELQRGAVDFAIVGGADTYFDPLVFDILEEREAIFDQRRTDAFIPGEGAAFALLTGERIAARFQLEPLAVLEAVATAEESASMLSQLPCLGQALTRVLRACTDRLKHDRRRLEWVFADLTNEEYRIREYQVALPRAIAPGGLDTAGATYQDVAADDMLTEFVPDGFGDLGAATMPTALALATEAFLRGDPARRNCLIVGCSVNEHRGALLVSRPE
jgi:3-oxoacyl-[acyl-carrier-protein] synthase-1